MIANYQGPFLFNQPTVTGWNSSAIGVYYVLTLTSQNQLSVVYVGVATGTDGIRGRLLQHLSERKWPDATHFGFCVCGTSFEASAHEANEIRRLQPKYNVIGK